jgi:hypothetical protein
MHRGGGIGNNWDRSKRGAERGGLSPAHPHMYSPVPRELASPPSYRGGPRTYQHYSPAGPAVVPVGYYSAGPTATTALPPQSGYRARGRGAYYGGGRGGNWSPNQQRPRGGAPTSPAQV